MHPIYILSWFKRESFAENAIMNWRAQFREILHQVFFLENSNSNIRWPSWRHERTLHVANLVNFWAGNYIRNAACFLGTYLLPCDSRTTVDVSLFCCVQGSRASDKSSACNPILSSKLPFAASFPQSFVFPPRFQAWTELKLEISTWGKIPQLLHQSKCTRA